MSSPAEAVPASPTSSYSDAYSFLSPIGNDNNRSRSSTLSYQTVNDSSSSVSFSDLAISSVGIHSPINVLAPGQMAGSYRAGNDEDDEDLILIPTGSTVLRSRSTTANSVSDLSSHSSDDGNAATQSPLPHTVGSFRVPGPASSILDDEESDTDSDDTDEDEDGEARARERRLREMNDGDSSSDESDGESILFRGEMQGLSLTSPATPLRNIAGNSPSDHRILRHDFATSPVTNSLSIRSYGGRTGAFLAEQDATREAITATPTRDTFATVTPTPPRDLSATPIPSRPAVSVSPVLLPAFQQRAAGLQSHYQTAAPIDSADAATRHKPSRTQVRAARRRRARLREKAHNGPMVPPQPYHSSSTESSTSSSDTSDTKSGILDDIKFSQEMYNEAVAYVTAYLKTPPQDPSADVKLHFLQSLIIELGLLSKGGVSLPTSCTAARTLLKSQVHLNVSEYVALRTRSTVVPQQTNPAPTKGRGRGARKRAGAANVCASLSQDVGVGVRELQKLMYPSKNALVRSLHEGSKKVRSISNPSQMIARVSVDWIKKRGLDVFLVSVFR